MNERLKEWMKGLKKGWKVKRMNECKIISMKGWKDKRMNEWMGE